MCLERIILWICVNAPLSNWYYLYIHILSPTFKYNNQWTKLIKLSITLIFIILNEHISLLLFQGQGVISNASSRLAKAKLRLLFEAAPIALIIEASGGSSCVCATETFEHIGAVNSPISVYSLCWYYILSWFFNLQFKFVFLQSYFLLTDKSGGLQVYFMHISFLFSFLLCFTSHQS